MKGDQEIKQDQSYIDMQSYLDRMEKKTDMFCKGLDEKYVLKFKNIDKKRRLLEENSYKESKERNEKYIFDLKDIFEKLKIDLLKA